jgi:hypothetical protein
MNCLVEYKAKRNLFRFLRTLMQLNDEKFYLSETTLDVLVDNFRFNVDHNNEIILEELIR